MLATVMSRNLLTFCQVQLFPWPVLLAPTAIAFMVNLFKTAVHVQLASIVKVPTTPVRPRLVPPVITAPKKQILQILDQQDTNAPLDFIVRRIHLNQNHAMQVCAHFFCFADAYVGGCFFRKL